MKNILFLFLSLSVSFYIILDAHLFMDLKFFSQFFFTSSAIYLCHSSYNFNVQRVGYGQYSDGHASWVASMFFVYFKSGSSSGVFQDMMIQV